MKVHNSAPRVVAIGPMIFRPGLNPDVKDADWAKYACGKDKKTPTKAVAALLKESDGPLTVELGTFDLGKMSEADAAKAVGEVLDAALLAKMLEGEKRGAVRKAIEAQQAKLKAPAKNE